MSNIVTTATPEDGDEIRRRLIELLGRFLANVVEIAKLIREAEDRGVDLSGIAIPFYARLRDIAYGKMLPEVFGLMPDRPGAMQAVAKLPAPVQKQIVDGERFPVVVPAPDASGKRTHRMMAIPEIPDEALRRVIANGKIRNVAEQNAILDEKAEVRQDEEERFGVVVVDHVRQVFKVKHTDVPLSDWEAALSAMRRRLRKRTA